ncbi:hypothetical protein AAFP30_14855 [Gordonia sp. CPCC 205515]|uniref:hypothetical protein n=1 Tax=Gordonia sp. CPCC 205515 TaxID=3140791 RepID=UPI003AF3F5DA
MRAGVRRWDIVREALTVLIPAVAFIVGCVLAFYSAVWALVTVPDLPGAYAVPSYERASTLPGPPIVYWLVWATPPVVVCGLGGLLLWRWQRGRWAVGALMVGFTLVFMMLALIWISMDVGGFAPD